jgi:G3E family GTPase
VVLNKIDLIDEKAQIHASQIIQKIAPWVRLLKGSYGDVSLDLLLGFRDSFPLRSVSSQLKSNPSDKFHTWSYQSDRPFQLLTLGKILGKLPVTVLRAKGILSTVEYPDRGVILQQAGRELP